MMTFVPATSSPRKRSRTPIMVVLARRWFGEHRASYFWQSRPKQRSMSMSSPCTKKMAERAPLLTAVRPNGPLPDRGYGAGWWDPCGYEAARVGPPSGCHDGNRKKPWAKSFRIRRPRLRTMMLSRPLKIRKVDAPVSVILRGNLAPDGCIVKLSALPERG